MNIEKNGKTYVISECKNHWTVKYSAGGLSVSFEVDKKMCETENELIEYVKDNDMF